jgi:hypothetical protein
MVIPCEDYDQKACQRVSNCSFKIIHRTILNMNQIGRALGQAIQGSGFLHVGQTGLPSANCPACK